MRPLDQIQAKITIEAARTLSHSDLADLCTATEDAIRDGGGFGWLTPPPPQKLEQYWQGLLLVPGRHLFLARLDGVIAGALQLWEAPRNMESQAAIGKIQSEFTAAWARGHGIGRGLVNQALEAARALGMHAVKLDVRATQTAAIQLYQDMGFQRWGTMPRYVQVEGRWVEGHYFYLDL